MANEGMSIECVKSICNHLEMSPGDKQQSSPILHGSHGGGGSTFKESKGGDTNDKAGRKKK